MACNLLNNITGSFVLAAVALALSACGGSAAQEAAADATGDATGSFIGLFTTLPIYWGGDADIAAIINNADSKPGWVRQELERHGELSPLDTLEAEHFERLDEVVLAQPRPLAPSENVALDNWVRGGGHVLIFADPMLTEHSDYALGDPRRSHDMVVLSPILSRWGLELRFDPAQPRGEKLVKAGHLAIPVDLPGSFVPRAGGEDAVCQIEADGLIARCRIGRGEAVLVADAAVLDSGADSPGRRAALAALLGEI